MLESCLRTGPVFGCPGAARRSGLGEGGRSETGSIPGCSGKPRYFDRHSCAPRSRVAGRCESKSAGTIRCRRRSFGGNDHVIWIPLRAGARTLGLAMVGYAVRKLHAIDLESLHARRMRSRLLSLITATPVRGIGAEELGSWSTFASPLCGVSVDRSCHRLPAPRGITRKRNSLRWAGPAITMLADPGTARKNGARPAPTEPFLHLWRRVLEEGAEVELAREALPPRRNPFRISRARTGSRDALPIEVRSDVRRADGRVAALHDRPTIGALGVLGVFGFHALDQEATRGSGLDDAFLATDCRGER